MLILILAIATIIGLVVSLSKAIRFLRNEEVSSAKTWGLIALTIISVFMIFVWLYKKIKGGDNQTLISGNLGNTFISNWSEGDYVRVKLLVATELYAVMDVASIPNGVQVSPLPPWKTKEISGYIKTPKFSPPSDTPELANVSYRAGYDVTVIGANGTGKGNTYFVPKTAILAITNESVPVEG